MKTSGKLFSIASVMAMVFGTALSPAAQANVVQSYTPCEQIKDELNAKVQRLRNMAQEREGYGDAYGARRLRNTANIITAHIGNLPCVGKQTCLCD